MGLDVYLYRCADWNKYDSTEADLKILDDEEYRVFKEENPGDYQTWSEDTKAKYTTLYRQQDARREKTLVESKCNLEETDMPSELYPNEHFKIGYFRSSYNDGGINNVANQLGLPGLHEIFESGSDEYYREIDWDHAKEVATEAVRQWEDFLNSDKSRFHVLECREVAERPDNPLPKGKKEALEVFFKELKDKKDFNYGSYYGDFFTAEPMKVLACIQGKPTFSFAGNEKSKFLIIENTSKMYDYYLKSIEIVLETIQYVLSQEDPTQYRLAWSG